MMNILAKNLPTPKPSRRQFVVGTAAIGATQGELRNIHLKYHLSTASLLSEGQMHRYAELRGYSGGKGPEHHRPRH